MSSHNLSNLMLKDTRDGVVHLQSKEQGTFVGASEGVGHGASSSSNFSVTSVDSGLSYSAKQNIGGSVYGRTCNGQSKKALEEIRNSLQPYQYGQTDYGTNLMNGGPLQSDESDIDKRMLERCLALGYRRDIAVFALKINKGKRLDVVLESMNSLSSLSGRKGFRCIAPGTIHPSRGVPSAPGSLGHPSPVQRTSAFKNPELSSSHTLKVFGVAATPQRGNPVPYPTNVVSPKASALSSNRLTGNGAQVPRMQGKTTHDIDEQRTCVPYMSLPTDPRHDVVPALEGVKLRQKKLEVKDPQKRWSAEVLQKVRALEIAEKRNSLEIPNRPPPPYPGYGQELFADSSWLASAGIDPVIRSPNLKRISLQDTQMPHIENLNRNSTPSVNSTSGTTYESYMSFNSPDVCRSQPQNVRGNLPGSSTGAFSQGQHPQQLMKDPPPYEVAATHQVLQRTHSPCDRVQLASAKTAIRPLPQAFTHASFSRQPIVDNQTRCFAPIPRDKFGSIENLNSGRVSDTEMIPRKSPPPYSIHDTSDKDKRMSINSEDLEFPTNKRSSIVLSENTVQSDSSASTSPTPDGVERSCSPLPMTNSPHHTLIVHKDGDSYDFEESSRDLSPFSTRLKSYSPNAFKFYMEQHVENVIKSQEQRKKRRKQLEAEMARVGLSEEAQEEMRKMLFQKETNYNRLKRAKMNATLFRKIKTIGVGAFGEVSLVRKTDTKVLYAMKTLRKSEVLRRNQVAHVKAERDILAEADNEWVVKLYYSFQDEENLYFVMDYVPGGDLMALLIRYGILTEGLARFYTSELVLAVESVHAMGFIHRDIKPDNILIDRNGHIKLTDFGLCTGFRWTHNSKYYQKNPEANHVRQYSMEPEEGWQSHNLPCHCCELKRKYNLRKPLERRAARRHGCQAHSLVGTPNYISPEVLMRIPYTQLCDWWSVGVILFEMVVGQPPFLAPSPAETQFKVINWKTELHIPTKPELSLETKDLIMKLCSAAEERIGRNGVDEIKRHHFFRQVDWASGLKNSKAPYIPKIKHATDTSNFDPVPENGCQGDLSEADKVADKQIVEQGPEHAFYEFTFRSFFDDGGYPYTIYDNEPAGPSGGAGKEAGNTSSVSSNKRTAETSGKSISVPNKVAAPPIQQGEKMPVYV